MKAEHRQGWLFVSPWVIGFALLTAGPMLYSLYLSFTSASLLSPPQWLGLENYRRLAADPLFYRSLGNTTVYAAMGVPAGLLLSLGLALLLNAPVRGLGFFRTLFFLPSVTNTVALSLLWLWLLNPEFGLLNAGLRACGLAGPLWLQSEAWAKPALVLMSLWTAGGQAVIVLAALQGVPRELTEAAAIDGASYWQIQRRITLPLLGPTLRIWAFLSIIGALQLFDLVFIIWGQYVSSTAGTSTMATYMVTNGRNAGNYGYGNAVAVVLFVISLTVALLYQRFVLRRDTEGALTGRSR